jgi:CubicO group peptidase (beta-lactamase class C family)
MKTRSLLCTIAFCFAPAVALAAAASGDTEFAAYAERLLQQFPADGPGVTVLVARGDHILYRGAHGMADLAAQRPMKPDDVMRIGSITKQFAAAGMLKLVDQGKVKLDDTLSVYLPDYPNGTQITLQQILNHTSGVFSYTSIPGYMRQGIRRDLDTAALIKVFSDLPPVSPPGQEWSYNNSGYVLVGAVLEAATKQPWYAYLQDSLLTPLQLPHTGYGNDPKRVAAQVPGYTMDMQGKPVLAEGISMTQPHAAGALLSNVDDLWHWNLALHGGKVLTPASYEKMITPVGLARDAHYGDGIFNTVLRRETVLLHSGGINGFVSWLAYLPRSGVSVVLLRNTDNDTGALDVLGHRLAAYAIGKPYTDSTPVSLPAEELKKLEGIYRKDADVSRTLRMVDGELTSRRNGGKALKLIAVGKDDFLFPNSLSRLHVERKDDGSVTAMRYFADDEGEGERWPRSSEALPSLYVLKAEEQQRLIGNYQAPKLQLKIFLDAQQILRLQVPGQPAFALQAESANHLSVPEVGANLEFGPVEGAVTELTLTQGPARLKLVPAKD